MAFRASVSSSASNSSTLPAISISSYPIRSCSQAFSIQHPSFAMDATIKFVPAAAALATIEVVDDAAAAAGASAFEAARAAAISAYEVDKVESDAGGEREWRDGTQARRERRRKRRMAVESGREIKSLPLKPANDGRILTPKAEAEYSFCLKEEARVEALRKRAEDIGGRRLTLAQWAKAAGISRLSLDMILCNGREAQEILISCYRRLVLSVAYAYKGKGLSIEDLIQEGNLGLLNGVKKFNPEKGYKLSTYVYWWIRQAISRAIAKKSKITRLPGSISQLVPQICEANAVLSRKLHQWPTLEEVAEVVNKDILTVGLALGRNREPISMNHSILDAGHMSLQEIIAGPKETTPEEMVKQQFKKRDLEKLLNGLCDSREVNILKLHYGLNGDAPLSFEEIGRQFRLSRERVRQISCLAMSKLQKANDIGDLKVYVE